MTPAVRSHARRSAFAVVATFLLPAAALAGCSNANESASTTTTTTGVSTVPTTSQATTTTSSEPQLVLADGTYVNGPVSQPHTEISWTNESGSSVTGSVDFVFQDGRTSQEFQFSGTASAGRATLTTTGGGPGNISATYSTSSLTMTGCTSYLLYTSSQTMCVFTHA